MIAKVLNCDWERERLQIEHSLWTWEGMRHGNPEDEMAKEIKKTKAVLKCATLLRSWEQDGHGSCIDIFRMRLSKPRTAEHGN